jgi:hypothetical protein
MPLLFFRSDDGGAPQQPWHSARAAGYGALIGAAAAVFKIVAPWSEPHSAAANAREVIGAALAFALLCAIASALRNIVARRLTRHDGQ